MKKISINVLRVSLLLVLGLCMFGVMNDVKAIVVTEEVKIGQNVKLGEFTGGIYGYSIKKDGKEIENSTNLKGKSGAIKVTLKGQGNNRWSNYEYLTKEFYINVKECGKYTVEITEAKMNMWSGFATSKETHTYNVTANKEVTLKEVTLKYDANGGSGAPVAEKITILSTGNKEITISNKKPTRAGFEFRGWTTTKVSSPKDARWSVQPGGKYKISGDATLYAIWEQTVKAPASNNNSNGSAQQPATQSAQTSEADVPTSDTNNGFSGNISSFDFGGIIGYIIDFIVKLVKQIIPYIQPVLETVGGTVMNMMTSM